MIPRSGFTKAAATVLLSLAGWFHASSNELEDVGRRIYWNDAPAEVTVEVGESSMAASATLFGCANCHGRDGLGGGDGGIRFPPIAASSLAVATPLRPAYDRDSFARALRQGIGAGGGGLDPSMPRYALPDSAVDALLAYLGRLETETRTGVGDETVLLGVAAPRERSEALTIVLDALAKVKTPQVFGRRLTLADVPHEEDPARFAQSLSNAGVFALVMPVLDEGGALLEAVRLAGVPVVAPWGVLSGFEKPDDVRAIEASLATREEALAGKAEELARERGEASVSVVETPPGEAELHGRTLVGTLDRLGPHAEALLERGAELFLLDTRFVPPETPRRRDVERQAEIALRLVIEGLRRSGADPTRARFMRELGEVRLDAEHWPALDYRLHPLTGTSEWRFIHLSNEQ